MKMADVRRSLTAIGTVLAVTSGITAGTIGAAAAAEEPTTTADEVVLLEENFSGGGLPEGWQPVAGTWQVTDGRLQATDPGGRTRIAFGPQAPTNFRIEATVNFVSVANSSRWLNIGTDYHAAEDWGAVFVARSNTTAGNGLELAQAARGGSYSSSPVGPAPVAFGTGSDHRMVIEAHGSDFTLSVDGEEALTGSNLRRTGGGFGFVINASTVQFDDVRITQLPQEPTGPSAPEGARLVSDTGDRISVSWAAPADPGADGEGTPATVSGYEVSIAPTATPESDLVWQPAVGLSHTFTGVPADQEQIVRIRAINDAGGSGDIAQLRSLRGANVDGLKLQVSGGAWPAGHVQGIAIDREGGYVYHSFTNLLVKTDLAGNVIGTIGGFTGHLGDLDFNPIDGRVYGSLEYKAAEAFYIAVIDGDQIDRVGMRAQNSPIFKAVYLPDVVDDFTADMDGDGDFDGDTGNTLDHRYGSSGIDGVSFGPRFGTSSAKQFLTVAYGIYANTSRDDNDHQVLLQYDTADWAAYEQPLVESAPHRDGPADPMGKFFVFTGNTTYGVQNLEYDEWLDRWFMGVYTGTKPEYPNYSLFAVDADAKPRRVELQGLDGERGFLLPLAADGLEHAATGIRGWRQKADVGFQSVGDGRFYLVRNGSRNGLQTADMTLERWTGVAEDPFTPVVDD